MSNKNKSYDYVIIGGGSAGSVLGNRLSEDKDKEVLVLEAGRSDYFWDLFIQMPAALMFPSGNKFYDWIYSTDEENCFNTGKCAINCYFYFHDDIIFNHFRAR